MSFNERRGKKEEGRRKREEGRGKKEESPSASLRVKRGKKEDFFPYLTLPISHSPTLSPPLPLSPVTTLRILPIKCFNYLGLATKSSKKLMKNQKKTALLKKWQYTLLV
ncbi:hypothetical protein [Microcoleus sp. BROC3]|uniref:hypothetical protein n=1 Tax=Microcoleus sp. BROC3 TaxID=3055323 RepID=UPI002FD5FC55